MKRKIILTVSILVVFAAGLVYGTDANSLYQQAFSLELAKNYTQALAAYQQMIAQYPGDSLAGLDNAGFRVKYLSCKIAIQNRDLATAKQIADQIKELACSTDKKPSQMYLRAHLFRACDPEYAEGLYQEVINQFPDSPFAGPDNAGYGVKYAACRKALDSGNIALARQIAEQIRNLGSSARQKTYQLYATAHLFKGIDPEYAGQLYGQLKSQFPDSPLVGPDYAGYWSKYAACRSSLANGDTASAGTLINEIIALPCSAQHKMYQSYVAERSFLSRALLSAGEADGKANQMLDVCGSLCDRIIALAEPNDMYLQLARMDKDAIAVVKLINNGNITAAGESISQFKVKYAGSENLNAGLFVIAEGYYGKGMGGGGGEFFAESVTLFEGITSGDLAASTQYMLGLNYDQLGEYAKAAAAFASSYQASDKFKYADYCLFAQGRCYEKLLEQKTISPNEGKSIITTQYSQLVSDYPQSVFKPYAESWLANKGSE